MKKTPAKKAAPKKTGKPNQRARMARAAKKRAPKRAAKPQRKSAAPIVAQKRQKATDQNMADARTASRVIAAIFDVREDDLWKPRKAPNANVRFARQAMHYVLNTELQLSVHVIADAFDRDRKTISPMLSVFEEAREGSDQDEALRAIGRTVRLCVDCARAWSSALAAGVAVAQAQRLADDGGSDDEEGADDGD